jgi:hypothetical protein
MPIKGTINDSVQTRTFDEPDYKKLAKAVINRAVLDVVGAHGNTGSISKSEKDLIRSMAKRFIRKQNKMLEFWCDMADTDAGHIVDFVDDLTYHINCGNLRKITPHIAVDRFLRKF